ncbi:MAG: hypothetical protein Q8K45_15515 [Rubrivivax sp.]|nr:hypothetical protein [Rubrivivax sp.]
MSRPEPSDRSAGATVMGAQLEPASGRRVARQSADLRRRHTLSWLFFFGLVLAVWQLTRLQLWDARSDFGYWMGVVGGVLMLLLFAYPLRKRWSLLARAGKTKHWFVVHMVLGIGGPLTILAHCSFRIGSVNAGVALFSMLVVALSGIAGRFIYLRIHRGLGGERDTLDGLRARLGFSADAVHTQLSFAPQAEARLRALEAHAGRPGDRWAEHLQRLLLLPLAAWHERRQCRRETDLALAGLAQARGWDAATLAQRRRRARRLVAEYTAGVLRVAQLAAYTRLFSLWHVLHVPFVFVMVLCAIAHIVAVHAY